MKYEAFHFNKCKQPKLARFEGKDGFYSPKARFFNTFYKFSLSLFIFVVYCELLLFTLLFTIYYLFLIGSSFYLFDLCVVI